MAKKSTRSPAKKTKKKLAASKKVRAIRVTNPQPKVRALPASGRFGRPRSGKSKPPYTATIYFDTVEQRDGAFEQARAAGLSLSAFIRGKLAG